MQTLILTHQIGDTFGITNPGNLSWLIAGYSLTVGTFILFTGRLGDLFGYKRMVIIGYIWFAVWSMVAGLAVYSNHVLFVFARVFQGIGPSILLPNALALFGASYAPGLRKNMVFAIFGACAPTGGVASTAIAGVFNLAWWPWTFWSLAILCAALAVASQFVLPSPPQKLTGHLTTREKIRDADLPGAVVGVTALVLFNFAWNQAPVVGWSEPYVYVTLILSVLLIPVFFYIELRVSPSPLIPFDCLSVDVGFVLGAVACGWATFGIWVYYNVQFLQVLRHTSPLQTSAQISPVAILGLMAALATGLSLGKLGPAPTMTISLLMFTTGAIILATTPVDQTYWAQTFVACLVTPFGMDMSFPAATVILSNAVSKKNQGIAASLVTTIVNYSISLGLGFAGTVEVHVNDGGHTPAQILKGYRGAEYLSIGISGLGVGICLLFLLKEHRQACAQKKAEAAGSDSA